MRWADIDAQSVLSTPFSDERFVAGLAAVFGWSVRRMDTHSGLHALLVDRQTGPLHEVVLPPFAPFTALAGSSMSAGLSDLCSRLRDEGRPALLSLPVGWPDPLPGLPGWTVLERETAVIATGDLESVLSAYSSSTRRSYRKHHEEFGFASFTEQAVANNRSTVESAIEATVELVSQAYGRHGRSLPGGSPNRLADLAMLMVHSGRAHVYTACRQTDGRTVAGIVVLHRGTTAWYWLSGSIPGPAMTVLVAHVAADLADRGIAAFDLMGANTTSIAEFKRRLGAVRAPYHHLLHAGTGMAAWLAKSRRMAGRLRRLS